MTDPRNTWEAMQENVRYQLMDIEIGRLGDARSISWLNAMFAAIELVRDGVERVYERREALLCHDWLYWLPWGWQFWLSEHWPRKWLPKL